MHYIKTANAPEAIANAWVMDFAGVLSPNATKDTNKRNFARIVAFTIFRNLKMKYLFIIAMVFILSASGLVAKPSNTITKLDTKTTELFDIHTAQLHANNTIYAITISKIKSPKTQPKKYRIFYMLDGNGHLPIALNALAKEYCKKDFLCDELDYVLLVGIGYGEKYAKIAFPPLRTRDYTPSIPKEVLDSMDNKQNFLNGGGAQNFLESFVQTIIPFVKSHITQSNLELSKECGIFGHSFGGLFVLYALSNATNDFNHFYAISPSLWWGNGEFIGQNRAIDFADIEGDSITLWIMQDTPKNPQTQTINKENPRGKAKINTKELATLIQSQSNITPHYKAFQGYTHGSVVVPAFLEAIRDFAK